MTACPDRATPLQAYFDNELGPIAAAELEAHLAGCPGCRDALARLTEIREAIAAAPPERAPDSLRLRVGKLGLGASDRPTGTGRRPFLEGASIGAAAAVLAALLIGPQLTSPGLADALVDAQVRSLQTGHLIDVATSDRHTVRPWFNGRVTFSPPVVDLKDKGFPLVGGRLDAVQRQTVAVLVFRRNLHTINLYIRPGGRGPLLAIRTRQAGYALAGWRADGLEFWAVSDVEPAELARFEADFRAAASP